MGGDLRTSNATIPVRHTARAGSDALAAHVHAALWMKVASDASSDASAWRARRWAYRTMPQTLQTRRLRHACRTVGRRGTDTTSSRKKERGKKKKKKIKAREAPAAQELFWPTAWRMTRAAKPRCTPPGVAEQWRPNKLICPLRTCTAKGSQPSSPKTAELGAPAGQHSKRRPSWRTCLSKRCTDVSAMKKQHHGSLKAAHMTEIGFGENSCANHGFLPRQCIGGICLCF